MSLIVVLLIGYVLELAFIGSHSMPFLHEKFNESSFNEKNDHEITEFLRTIVNDKYNCYYCINNHSSFMQIDTLVDNQQRNINILQEFKHIRCLYNILNITNLIVVFIIYGGPKIINVFF